LRGRSAAGPADAQELGRGLILVRREHDPEGRHDGVEARVGERQSLGVGFLERDCQAFGCGAPARVLQQRRDVVAGDDIAPAARGSERHVSVAGRNVEHLLSCMQVQGFAQAFADDLQRGAHDRVVARRPGGVLARLHGAEIGDRRCLRSGQRCGGHGGLLAFGWSRAG
jgi:hypothetical protein